MVSSLAVVPSRESTGRPVMRRRQPLHSDHMSRPCDCGIEICVRLLPGRNSLLTHPDLLVLCRPLWKMCTMDGLLPTILVIDDDLEIRRLVANLLRREGFAVETAEDAVGMDAVLARLRPDLVVLDLMLPGEDGLSICRRIRAGDSLPILMLTAKHEEIDRVVGLEMGADDYLVKPFGPRELLARVRAVLRRASVQSFTPPTRRFAFDRFIIDLDARELTHESGEILTLTSGEFDLLACFVQRPRRVLSRDQILDWTRGRNADPFDRSVDTLVSRLRKRLDTAGPEVKLISTVRSGGYLFTAFTRPIS